MAKKPAPFTIYKDQHFAVETLKKQGFKEWNNSRIGIIMARLDQDGFIDKRAVTKYGRVLRYKATQPCTFEREVLRA